MRLFSIFVFLSISFLSVNADSKMVTEDKLMSIVEKQDMKYEHFKETTELNLKHKLETTKNSLDETNVHIGYVSDRIDNISASVDRFAMLTTFFGVLITIIVFFFSFKSNSEARQTVEDWLDENGDDFVNKEVQPIKDDFNKMIIDMQKEMESFKQKSDEEIEKLKEQLEEKGNEVIESLSSKIIENEFDDPDLSIKDNQYFEYQIRAIHSKPLIKRTLQDYKKMIIFNIGKKNYSEAKALIENQLQKKYTNIDKGSILYLKGLLEYKQTLYNEAIKSFENSLSVAPNLISTYIALAKVYSLKSRNYSKAIEFATKALHLDSHNYSAYISLGFANRNIAYFEKQPQLYKIAISYIEKAININPNLAAAYYALGSICLMQSKYFEAKKWYEIPLKDNVVKWEYNEWSCISLLTIYLLLDGDFPEALETAYVTNFSEQDSEYFLTYKVLKVLVNIKKNKYLTKKEIKDSIEILTSKEKKIKYFFFYKLEYLVDNENNIDIKDKLAYGLKIFDNYRLK